jgi:uncharacterized protein (DUF362 family)
MNLLSLVGPILAQFSLGGNSPGKTLFLKPNCNSVDVPPGSTHDDVLSTLVHRLQAMGVDRITVGDRSGMGDTRKVMEQKDIFRMGNELGFGTVVFDDLTPMAGSRCRSRGGTGSRGSPWPARCARPMA